MAHQSIETILTCEVLDQEINVAGSETESLTHKQNKESPITGKTEHLW